MGSSRNAEVVEPRPSSWTEQSQQDHVAYQNFVNQYLSLNLTQNLLANATQTLSSISISGGQNFTLNTHKSCQLQSPPRGNSKFLSEETNSPIPKSDFSTKFYVENSPSQAGTSTQSQTSIFSNFSKGIDKNQKICKKLKPPLLGNLQVTEVQVRDIYSNDHQRYTREEISEKNKEVVEGPNLLEKENNNFITGNYPALEKLRKRDSNILLNRENQEMADAHWGEGFASNFHLNRESTWKICASDQENVNIENRQETSELYSEGVSSHSSNNLDEDSCVEVSIKIFLNKISFVRFNTLKTLKISYPQNCFFRISL